ncbi:MAG: NAD(P)-binding protein [Desulfotomaculaceae bacterium]|nr:NAD(P)-binding protein [Desulfotomaculaceae bacterium]
MAIIGAGPSGFACAHELERHGVKPDIFEQRPRPGDLFEHVGVILQITNRPVKDQLAEIKKSCYISLKPLNSLKKVTMHSPRVSGSVSGNLGYLFKRGQGEDSVENQLLALIKAPVHYNTRPDYASLALAYDYVVVATGNYETAKILGCLEDIYKTWLVGATVLGEFHPNYMEMWLNTEYAGSAYAYLTPFNHKSASLVLIVPEGDRKAIDCWKKFLRMEKLSYEFSSLWIWEHVAGFVYPHQVGNILFVGNAGGFLRPVLGFALYNAILSGVFAARSMIEGKNYEDYLVNLNKNMMYSLQLRESLNSFTNKHFDHLVAFLTTPGFKQIIYNTNLDMIKYMAILARLIGTKNN